MMRCTLETLRAVNGSSATSYAFNTMRLVRHERATAAAQIDQFWKLSGATV
jgi:hypothetical protein